MSETVTETAAIAKNYDKEDNSMENPQMDDEEEKNSSAEDILGGKTLLMSDSEDDETPTTECKQILPNEESREEDHDKVTLTIATNNLSNENDAVVQKSTRSKPTKKICAIIDSDSEEEQESVHNKDVVEGKEQEKISNNKYVDDNRKSKPKPKRRICAIIDTDSEDEQMGHQVDECRSTQSNSHSVGDHLKSIVDSESDYGSDSELDNTNKQVDRPQESNEPTDKSSKTKTMRASAKKALDEMKTIQSEQQRLHRESHISIPYHQPKPRSLKEFLNRRTINQPLAVAMAGGSPMPRKNEARRAMALRMNSEELLAYAKLMEERAKEATEFFKSESEHEEEDGEDVKDNPDDRIFKPYQENRVKQLENMTTETADSLGDSQCEQENIEEVDIVSTFADSTVDGIQKDQPAVDANTPTKINLVTEIMELPKIDLNTLNITPQSNFSTPRISEAIRRLKEEKSCDISPCLEGDTNMVIDLETGDMFAKKQTGVDNLLERLMKTREAKKVKTTDTVNILSAAHGKLELSKVSIHLHQEEAVNKEQKPGAAYQKLQDQLKTLITKKRMEELRKKQESEMEEDIEELSETECLDMEESEPEISCKNELLIDDNEEIIDEDAENDTNECKDAGSEEDSEDETKLIAESVDDAQASDVEVSTSDSEQESEEENTQKSKRKNRIIRAFQDDNSDEDDDLLQTPKSTNAAPLTATELQLSTHKLFDSEIQRTASDEENELLGLCSGKFTETQMTSEAPTTGAVNSQILNIQANSCSRSPDNFVKPNLVDIESQPLSDINKILSSDEEPLEKMKEDRLRSKKLTKKRQKKVAKLGFSDDEESDEDVADNLDGDQLDTELDEAGEEIPESFVDYDSEENEIVVQMTKKDKKLRAANFVEKEAELSESEWGSADEDEKNMDKYDIELGDEDEFDREKLRHELGQIHARKMLDQDIREVRKIQDMLFEDEEGAVRQRQFRWKNTDNSMGFNLDDPRNENVEGENNEGSGDEENEHLWRKIRYEREQLLQDQKLNGTATNNTSSLPKFEGSTTKTLGTIRKLTFLTNKVTGVEAKKSSPFLISKNATTVQPTRAVRGSFLVRDKETLNKLAGLTKNTTGDIDGTAGTVSVKSAKAKNFVFATLTEEEHENQKRKAADLLNSSSETGTNFMKKPRLEPRREKCLIDQLL